MPVEAESSVLYFANTQPTACVLQLDDEWYIAFVNEVCQQHVLLHSTADHKLAILCWKCLVASVAPEVSHV